MPDASSPDTPNRILACAEALFARHGFAGVSLREITRSAGVNVASVNYHFYDKESLYRTIIKRHLHLINHERLELLQRAETRFSPERVPVDNLIDALARPVFFAENPNGPQLLGRLLFETTPSIVDLVQSELEPIMNRFGHALRRHQPSIPAAEFLWKLSFVIGALHHAALTFHSMKRLTQGVCADGDAHAALAAFTGFGAAALR